MKRFLFLFLTINFLNYSYAEEFIIGNPSSKLQPGINKKRSFHHLSLGYYSTLGFSENKLSSLRFNELSAVYDQLQTNSETGNFSQTGNSMFTSQNFEVSFFPIKGLNLGFSSGVGFCSLNTEILLDNLFLSYRAKDFEGNSYNRMITSEVINNRGGIREQISLKFVDIPFFARYLAPLDRQGKKNFSMDAGVIFRNLRNGNSKAFVTANYEGKYFLDEKGNYLEPFSGEPGSANGWDQTRESTERLFPDNPKKVNERFNSLYHAGYDVGLDNFFFKEGKLKFNSSLFWVLRPSFMYYYSKSILVNAGLNINFGRYQTEKERNYKPLDSRKDDQQNYSSFINGTPNFSGINTGVFFGVNFGLTNVETKSKKTKAKF